MENRHIGYFIKGINDKLKVRADADLKEQELTLSQSRIVMMLSERGGTATQKEIEDFLEVSHPTVVGLVSRMEQKGFLTTCFDPLDKRNKIVSLTEKALGISRHMNASINASEEKMLNGLSGEDIAALERLLSIIHKNLE